jgi:glutathione S-transferase
MIDYYTAKELGGNTRKISIMLAETGLEHVVHFIDLAAGVQQQDWFLDINPNGRIPAIVDRDIAGGHRLGESGAILVYLAEKADVFRVLSRSDRAPFNGCFGRSVTSDPCSGNCPLRDPHRTCRVRSSDIGRRACALQAARPPALDHEYVAGEYSIADMSLYSWIKPHERFAQVPALQMVELSNSPLVDGGARDQCSDCNDRYEGTALRPAG